MKKKLLKAVMVSMLCAPLAVRADDNKECDFKRDWMSSACQRVMRVAHDGTWDLYIAGYGWHIDGFDNRSELNPWSYGGGRGQALDRCERQRGHPLRVRFFGFASQLRTDRRLRTTVVHETGARRIAGGRRVLRRRTARSDIAHYLPLPLALPIGSIRYRRASVMATIIPHIPGLNDGDVAFFWGRYEF